MGMFDYCGSYEEAGDSQAIRDLARKRKEGSIMTTRGIDYGMGNCNIDKSNGIRFGVIHQNEVLQAWADSSEADYGEPHCPKCGNEAVAGDSEMPLPEVPDNFSVKELDEDDDAEDRVTCGTCGRSWDDAIPTTWTPAPSGRCPFEYYHADQDSDREQLGYEVLYHACGDYACDFCRVLFDGEDAFGDEPLGFTYDEDGYQCQSDSYGDIFILKSPYFTRAQFCSPCAPGACYLTSPTEDGERAYCFDGSWFESGEAPYPVYSVETGELVKTEKE